VNGSATTRFNRIKLARSVLPARQRRHHRRHVVGCNRVLLHQTGLGAVLIGEQVWKTDSLDNVAIESKVIHYAPQLASYRFAVAKLLGLSASEISTFLIFVKAQKIVEVP